MCHKPLPLGLFDPLTCGECALILRVLYLEHILTRLFVLLRMSVGNWLEIHANQLKAAMSAMDQDNDGTISFEEFESWWRTNGGDLELYRALAFTVVLPDLHLLLVRIATRTCRQTKRTVPHLLT